MPNLNLFSDLNKLTSSPMKLPLGVPVIDSYSKTTDSVAPCIRQQHQEFSSSFSPAILSCISSDDRHEKTTQPRERHQQRLSSSSSSSSSTPTSSFMAKAAPNSLSPQRHYRRVFSFLNKQNSKDAPSTTTTTTTTRRIKKQKSLVGAASWIMFKKSSNRSPSAQHQQQQQSLHTSSIGGGGVFISADEPLVPGACTCTDPTTLKMDRTKQSHDSSIMTTTITTTTAASATKHEHPPSGVFRTLPSLLSGDTVGSGTCGKNQKKKRSKRKVYDPAQWPCALVQDTIEQDRLVAQHYLLRMAFDGDHHAPVQSLLSQRQQHHALFSGSNNNNNNNKITTVGGDETIITSSSLGSATSSLYNGQDSNNTGGDGGGPVVLDVGCGLGQWSMEMATAYPKSTFIGIDILSTFPKDIKPRNCHFIQANVKQLPLPFADHSIDFIYQRDLNWGLGQEDWYPLIKEYLRILKPGGWIELVEADLETKSSLEKECAMNDKLLEGFYKRQQDPFVARRLPTMLAVHGFRRVESHFQSLPLGWKNNLTGGGDNHINNNNNNNNNSSSSSSSKSNHYPVTTTDDTNTPGKQVQAMTSQYLFYLRSLCPWLRLVMGLSQAKYIDYVDQLPREWEQAQTYVNWHCATAQKPYE